MDTEKLIEQLSAQGAAKPQISPFRLSILLNIGLMCYIGLLTGLMMNGGAVRLVALPMWLQLELVMVLVLIVLGLYAGSLAMLPDQGQQHWPLKLLYFMVLFFLIILLYQTGVPGELSLIECWRQKSLNCLVEIALLSIPPAVVFLGIGYKFGSGFSAKAEFCFGIATGLCGYLVVLLADQDHFHSALSRIMWHLPSVALITILAVIIGRRLMALKQKKLVVCLNMRHLNLNNN